MKKIISLVVLAVACTTVYAQSDIRQGRMGRHADNRTKKVEIPKETVVEPVSAEAASDDTLYCSWTCKRHGWIIPLDTLRKDMVSHRHCTIRLTQKNKAGNWCRIEFIGAYGNYNSGYYSPYILDLSHPSVNEIAAEGWVDKVKNTSIVEMVSDPAGNNVVQERAYDKDMKLIYSFSRTKVGDNQYVGSYKDAYGLPAEMRKDNEGLTYGTLIRITENEYGYETLRQMTDAKGNPKFNDGVPTMRIEYDEHGHQLRKQALDADGLLTIDDWGNCGIEIIWDKENHQISSEVCMDDKWKPMRMPSTISKKTYIVTNYLHDSLKRMTAEYYTDINGQPDTVAYGLHKVVYEYDDRGNHLGSTGYGLNGELASIDESGTAISRYEYDNMGRILSGIYLDKWGKPCSTDGYLSRVQNEYDDDGSLISDVRYIMVDGKEQVSYRYTKSKDETRTLWNDGTTWVELFDAKGRTTFKGYYGIDGKFEAYEGRAYEKYDYIDRGDSLSTLIKTFYDEKDNNVAISEDIFKSVVVSNYSDNTYTYYGYDANGTLVRSYILQYDQDWDIHSIQYNSNFVGKKSRTPSNNGIVDYSNLVLRNQKGNVVGFASQDEFGEPDYSDEPGYGLYSYQILGGNGRSYFDENDREIRDRESIVDSLYKVMTIEVTDSSAYAKGLRDNDLVLIYGNYSVDLDSLCTKSSFTYEWASYAALEAKYNKRMIVFRIENASENQYGLVEIKDLTGTPSQVGFYPHIRYLTEKQRTRIKEAITKNIQSESPLVKREDFKKDTTKVIPVLMTIPKRSWKDLDKPYIKQVAADPGFILGTCVDDMQLSWVITRDNDFTNFMAIRKQRQNVPFGYPEIDYFISTDLQSDNIKHLSFSEELMNAYIGVALVSKLDLMQLHYTAGKGSVEEKIDEQLASPSSTDPESLFGNWEISWTDTTSAKRPHGNIYFKDDHKCYGTFTTYGVIEYIQGTVHFRIDTDYYGTWEHKNNLIRISPFRGKYNMTVSCVDVIAETEEQRTFMKETVDRICRGNRMAYLDMMDYTYKPFGNNILIEKIGDGILILKNGTEEGMALTKTRKNPNLKEMFRDEVKRNAKNLAGMWKAPLQFADSFMNLTIHEDGKFSIEYYLPYHEVLNTGASINFDMKFSYEGNWTLDEGLLEMHETEGSLHNEVNNFKTTGATEEMAQGWYETAIKNSFAVDLLEDYIIVGKNNIPKLTSKILEIKGMKFVRTAE